VIRTPSPRADVSPAGRNDDDSDHWRPWGHRDDRFDRRPGKGRFFDGKGKGKGKSSPLERASLRGFAWGSGGKGGKGGGFRSGGYQVSSTRVHVSNLPRDITEGNLEHLFGQHGHVLGLQLLGGGGRGQMCAIIRFSSSDDAEASIEALHGQHEVRPGDGPLVVKLAKPNPRWDS